MSRLPNIFTDPNTGNQYFWEINHSEEESVAKSRQMSDGAPTSDIGLLPAQGSDTPLIFQWKGTIFTKAQLTEMIFWFNLCRFQSIYLTDFSGSAYEVIITDFAPTRRAVAANRRDLVNAPGWLWDYSITFRVIGILSGEWVGTAP